MAFNARGLNVLNTAQGPAAGNTYAIAAYFTDDAVATVAAANYFNAAAALLPKGSQITVAFDLDGTPGVRTYMVSANTGAAVTITAAS